MRSRKVIITRKSEVADPDTLAAHPNVRDLWLLPRGHVLFEFYHPVFEKIYDTDQRAAKAARRIESVRADTAQAVAQEQRLLWNLYRDFPQSSETLMLLVPSQTSFYNFAGRYKRSIAWPSLGCSMGWETTREIRIAGRLAANIPETLKGLRTVFEEWSASASARNNVRMGSKVDFEGEYFNLECSFSETCGDATMGLYMLLADTRSLTSLQSVGFFLLADYATPFRQIGDAAFENQQLP